MKCVHCNNEISDNSVTCEYCCAEVFDYENLNVDTLKSSQSKSKKILYQTLREWHSKSFQEYKSSLRYYSLQDALSLLDCFAEYYKVMGINLKCFEHEIPKLSLHEIKIANAILAEFVSKLNVHIDEITNSSCFKKVHEEKLISFGKKITKLFLHISSLQQKLTEIDSSLKLKNTLRKAYWLYDPITKELPPKNKKKNIYSKKVNEEHINFIKKIK